MAMQRHQEAWPHWSGRARVKQLHESGLALPLVYGAILILLSPVHHVFNEWGGVMQYFAGREILAGNGYLGWTSHFWPPLFSILIGLGSLLLPGFVAGKLISVVTSAALLHVTYLLTLEVSADRHAAHWTQAFLAVSPWFFYEALRAHNHMLDALLFGLGLLLFLRALRNPTPVGFAAAGAICGLAGLSRYTSYVLFALPIFIFLFRGPSSFARAARLAFAFWAGVFIVSLPWWYYNAATNGSPLYTWHYLNLCSTLVAKEPHALRALWWCSDQPYESILHIIASHPYDYVRNLAYNIIEVAAALCKSAGVLAPFVIPGVLHAILTFETRKWMVLLGVVLLYGLLVSQSALSYWHLLPLSALAVIMSVPFVFAYSRRCEERYRLVRDYRLAPAFLVVLMAIGTALSSVKLLSYVREQSALASLADLDEIARALRQHDANLSAKTIMAVDPARAYYANARYLQTPSIYAGSVAGLVSYAGLSAAVRAYAPKYPAKMTDLRADYLIYTRPLAQAWGGGELPQFEFLFEPQSGKLPRHFHLIYWSRRAVVYEISHDAG
jgi:hypothetical protein